MDGASDLPPGFTLDADDDSAPADDNAEAELPKGFKLDGAAPTADETGAGDPTAYAEKIANITDPKEAGRVARAYNPGGGESGFDPIEGIKSVAGLAADYGASVLQSGSNLARAAGVTAKDSDPLSSGAEWLRKNVPLTDRAKAAETGLSQSLPAKVVAAPVRATDAALGAISPDLQRQARGVGKLVSDVANVAAPFGAAGKLGKAADAIDAEPAVLPRPPPLTAEENLAGQVASSKGNMGAAEAAPSLEGVSPQLKTAIANAKNIHGEALQRHVNADTLPMPEGQVPAPLRKGQATRDDQQISDEKNMRADPDTQGLLTKSINDQNDTMGASMGEIRQRATPNIVRRSTQEHGQSAVDAIKAQDNSAVTDIRGKYKALADAADGVLPMDTGSAAKGIDEALQKALKVRVAEGDSTISEIMEKLRSGEPMTFDTFNNAISNLGEVQGARTPASAAAKIVRNGLEAMPLGEQWAHLKGLRDTASSAAKARFDTIEGNPAYEAAINDNVKKTPAGLHQIGAPSPLADRFMDTYFLGNGASASTAYVARIKKVMEGNSDFSPAIEASSLNKLRDAAKLDQYDTGNFASASFRNAHNAVTPKADVLMSPQTVDNLGRLRQYSDDVSYEGKASSVNRSNTALTLQRFGAEYPASPSLAGTLTDYGTDLAAGHLGPVTYAATKIGKTLVKGSRDAKALQATKDAKLKFAQDATAPGAGIDTAPASPIIARASGGKVDHEALTARLFARWKQAQKEADRTTEPLLKFPDETITRALKLASARPMP